MNITALPYTHSPHQGELKALYHLAFPKYEQMPWWLLRLLTVRKGVELTAYYQEETFCGFTHTTVAENILFVMFFAVDDKLRGKGYGSAILRYLKESNPDKAIVLNVERLDETADNYAQRARRFKFYEKNGFFDTHYEIDEVGGTFRVLSTSPTLDPRAYGKVFRKMSFGLWRPPITPIASAS